MVSTILTHAQPACAARSFAVRKIQLPHIEALCPYLYPAAFSVHIECEKSGGVFA